MSDAVRINNPEPVLNGISRRLKGSARISNEALKDNKDNLQYRTMWAEKDAVEKILTPSNVEAALTDMGDWSEGENPLQRLSRQLYAEIIARILNDPKIASENKGKAKNAIQLSGRWGE